MHLLFVVRRSRLTLEPAGLSARAIRSTRLARLARWWWRRWVLEQPEGPYNLLIPLDVRESLQLVLCQLFPTTVSAFSSTAATSAITALLIGIFHQNPLDVLQRHTTIIAWACAIASLHVPLKLSLHLVV